MIAVIAQCSQSGRRHSEPFDQSTKPSTTTLREPLHAAARHFVDVITVKATPMSDGQAGLRIVKVLEAASQSLACQGRPISVGDRTPV